jgi:cytoskeletal protein CcmA (bactofilin family)
MFGTKKKQVKTSSNSIDSLISAGTTINGAIQYNGGLKVDGKVFGKVDFEDVGEEHTVMVGPTGEIHGDIIADNVIIDGVVHGSINAKSVFISASARIYGDISFDLIQVDSGAIIVGKLKSFSQAVDEADIDTNNNIFPLGAAHS